MESKDKRWDGEGFLVGVGVRGGAYFCIPSCEEVITGTSMLLMMSRSKTDFRAV